MNCHHTAKKCKAKSDQIPPCVWYGKLATPQWQMASLKQKDSDLLARGTEGVLSFCGDIGLASKLQAVSQNLMMQGLGWS